MKRLLAKLNEINWGIRVAMLATLSWVLAWAFRQDIVDLTVNIFPKGPWFYPKDSAMVLLILLFLVYCIAVNQMRESAWPAWGVLLVAAPLFYLMVEWPGSWQLKKVTIGHGHPDPQCGFVTWDHIDKYGFWTNSLGFADDEIPPKEPGEFRIVLVGDSSTHGYLMNGSARYPDYLTPGLRSQGHTKVRVINCGGAGLISLSGARLMERLKDRIQPDLFVISYNNDPRAGIHHARVYRELGPSWVESVRYWVFQCELVHACVKLGFNVTHAPQPWAQPPKPDWRPWTIVAYRDLFAMTPGPDLVLVMPLPAPTAEDVEYRRLIEELAREDGSVICDVFTKWQAEGIQEFLDDCHPTFRGHQILAGDLLKTLEPMLQQRLVASP